MNKEAFRSNILSGAYDEQLKRVYVTQNAVKEQEKRYAQLFDLFCEEFNCDSEVTFVSAPGRTEVCGNHTDHNKGKVLAAAINLDAVAACRKVDGNLVSVKSVGYPMDTIDLLDLNVHTELYSKSSEIIRGMCAGFVERGYKVGGF